MARRKLSPAEQLKGIEKAIESPRTPPQLKEGLRRRAGELRKKLQAGHSRNRGSSLLEILGLQ